MQLNCVEVSELLAEETGDRLTFLPHFFGTSKLVNTEGRGNISEVVFVPRCNNAIIHAWLPA